MGCGKGGEYACRGNGEIVKKADRMRLEMMNELVRGILLAEQAEKFLVAVE